MKLISQFLILFTLLCSFNSFAAIDEYEFSNDIEQERFKKLTDEMRCPKCLNANLSGSDAPIAADLRAEIYDQIQEGRSNDEIIEFMRERYGDFILYRPPLNANTFLLWFGPGILLILGFVFIRRTLSSDTDKDSTKKSEQLSSEHLSVEEEDQLAEFLKPSQGDKQ